MNGKGINKAFLDNTDLIYSSDDDGWYFHQFDFARNRDRVSESTYSDRGAALEAWHSDQVTWESWR